MNLDEKNKLMILIKDSRQKLTMEKKLKIRQLLYSSGNTSSMESINKNCDTAVILDTLSYQILEQIYDIIVYENQIPDF